MFGFGAEHAMHWLREARRKQSCESGGAGIFVVNKVRNELRLHNSSRFSAASHYQIVSDDASILPFSIDVTPCQLRGPPSESVIFAFLPLHSLRQLSVRKVVNFVSGIVQFPASGRYRSHSISPCRKVFPRRNIQSAIHSRTAGAKGISASMRSEICAYDLVIRRIL